MLYFRPEFLVLNVHFNMDYLLESTQTSYDGSDFFFNSDFSLPNSETLEHIK